MLLLLLACTGEPDEKEQDSPDPSPSPPTWDAGAAPIACAPGGDAALLTSALADAGLDRDDLGYTEDEWSVFAAYVDDPFTLSWYTSVHHAPEQVPCFAGQVQADLDTAAAGAHPVAALLGAYAPYVDASLIADPVDPGTTNLEAALSLLVTTAGGGDDPVAAASLDAELASALVPIVMAINGAISARHAMDSAVSEWSSSYTTQLYNDGAGWVLYEGGVTFSPAPDVSNSDEYEWFAAWYASETGPRSLIDPARQIAFAIEDGALSRFAGTDTSWRFATAAGDILISPATDDIHTAELGPLLLHLELGGADTYTGQAGANLDPDNPVAVLVDLGGADTYGYDEVPDTHDVEGALVSDEDGRFAYAGNYVSGSTISRQGAGRYGVGLLYDMGGSDDRYASLRMSQGFGSMGVGVLADDGGNDTYTAEAGAQGAGVFGLGVAYDGGGDDTWSTWAFSQGFAYVGSGGLLYDEAGSDVYWSDPGNDWGGLTLYYSPQLASGQGNSSFTQGAGFGMRADSYGIWLAGGFGTLRDAAGDDDYTSGVFGQGTGYWQGTGLLADADGQDAYDALWYIQGGAAHFALGILVDGGGADQYNPDFTPYNVMLGSGHDMSLGVSIDESGDDTYHYTSLAAGASNCQGVGIFVDNDGADTYDAGSTYSTGLGNHSSECNESTGRPNIAGSEGLFLDSGGDADTYNWPGGDGRSPTDNTAFGLSYAGTSDEFGGAVDGDGETGFHAKY